MRFRTSYTTTNCGFLPYTQNDYRGTFNYCKFPFGRIIAVAVGPAESLDWDELRAIASSDHDLIKVGDYVDLIDFLPEIYNQICKGWQHLAIGGIVIASFHDRVNESTQC